MNFAILNKNYLHWVKKYAGACEGIIDLDKTKRTEG